MSDLRDRDGPGTYLTPEEAKEFHKLFITSFIIFTVIAIIAHFLAWNWRSWGGDYAMIESGVTAAKATVSMLA